MSTEHTALTARFWRLAVPNILSALLVPIAGLVDMAMLGHLDSISHLAGVALASVIFDYLYWGFGFLRMTTTGLTAQAVGRSDTTEVYATGLRGVVLALGIGMAILALGHPIADLGFGLLDGDASVEEAGLDYFSARVLAAPATMLNFVFIGWFLGQERSDIALILSAVGNFTNIVLDYIFIYLWGWASWGAGLATALSQYLLLVVAVAVVIRQLPRTGRAEIWQACTRQARFKELIGLNTDMFIRTFVLQTTFAVFTNAGALMGTTALAANAVLLKVLSVASYFIDGYAYALESLAGIFYGQGRGDELRRVLSYCAGVSVLTGLALVGLFVGFPDVLFGMLTSHEDVLVIIKAYAPWLFLVVGIGAVAYTFDGYFIGLTNARAMRQSMILVSCVGFAPVAYWAMEGGSNHVLWASLVAGVSLRAIGLGRYVPATLRSGAAR